MIEYKNILVMGAGAVGGYFGGRIAEKTSASVTLVARGNHLKALQTNGLHIKSIDGDSVIKVNAIEDPAQTGTPDLILFTVKSYDTLQAIKQVKPVVGDHTQILTIQNGIENYPKLVDAFGEEQVIQGFCKIGAGISKPGVIQHKAFGEITVGKIDGQESKRLKQLQILCDKAQIPLHISNEIQRNIWLKFAWNCVFNMLTTVGNVTVEKLFEHTETEQLCYAVFNEIRMVADAEGILLTVEDGQNFIEPARKLEGFTTSTYQDRQKGKKLEFEAFTGAVIRLAQTHGIRVPHNQAIYAILKLIDNN